MTRRDAARATRLTDAAMTHDVTVAGRDAGARCVTGTGTAHTKTRARCGRSAREEVWRQRASFARAPHTRAREIDNLARLVSSSGEEGEVGRGTAGDKIPVVGVSTPT